ncbi:MAG: hypothetical protein ACI9XR_001522 [Flavobacterium sp.]|jgi:hypothetical protein
MKIQCQKSTLMFKEFYQNEENDQALLKIELKSQLQAK